MWVDLIYDRTDADIQEARVLRRTGRNIKQRLKGCYDYIDRNRVGNAVNQIAAWMNDNGYRTSAQGVVNWTKRCLATRARSFKMLQAVDVLRRDFVTFCSSPSLPLTLDRMDFNDANDIERLLFDLQIMISWVEKNRVRHFGDLEYFE